MLRARLGVVASLLFLLCLTIYAPARLLSLVLPGDQIILQGLTGSLWRGSASRAMLATDVGHLQLGAVDWQLQPLSLLLLSPSLELNTRWGAQTAKGQLTLHGSDEIGLREFEASVSADLVRQFVPLGVTGTVSVQLQHLLLENNFPVSGEGRILWQDGGWQSPQGPMALGSYVLDFSQRAGEPLVGEIVTLSGNTQAEGRVELADHGYLVDITLSASAGQRLGPQLQRALSLVARPTADGAYQLSLDGEF